MTDIPIPADILEAARKIAREVFDDAERRRPEGTPRRHAIHESEVKRAIARAILTDRAAQAERMARLEEAMNFVARWAWRTDPPNATGHLTDTDRLSCIKHHPTIKKAAQPLIDLAEAEAIRNLEPRHD